VTLRTAPFVKLDVPQHPKGIRIFPRRQLLATAEDYDVIIAPETEQEQYLPHAFRPCDCRVPVVSEIGASYSAVQWLHLFAGACSRSIRPSDVFMVKSKATERFFRSTWSEWSRWMPGIEPPSTAVIPQAIDLSENRKDESARQRVRSQLGISAEVPVALTFSRFNPGTKGDHAALIALWAEVIAQVPDAMLILAGAAGSRGFLEELQVVVRQSGAAGSVILLPSPYELWGDARTALMSAADIFLHLSTGME
jgi:glycosyltransferase involved in cell wall biosynthesis